MKLGISGKSSEDYFSQRDRLWIMIESKSELDYEEELEEWDENTKSWRSSVEKWSLSQLLKSS